MRSVLLYIVFSGHGSFENDSLTKKFFSLLNPIARFLPNAGLRITFSSLSRVEVYELLIQFVAPTLRIVSSLDAFPAFLFLAHDDSIESKGWIRMVQQLILLLDGLHVALHDQPISVGFFDFLLVPRAEGLLHLSLGLSPIPFKILVQFVVVVKHFLGRPEVGVPHRRYDFGLFFFLWRRSCYFFGLLGCSRCN